MGLGQKSRDNTRMGGPYAYAACTRQIRRIWHRIWTCVAVCMCSLHMKQTDQNDRTCTCGAGTAGGNQYAQGMCAALPIDIHKLSQPGCEFVNMLRHVPEFELSVQAYGCVSRSALR